MDDGLATDWRFTPFMMHFFLFPPLLVFITISIICISCGNKQIKCINLHSPSLELWPWVKVVSTVEAWRTSSCDGWRRSRSGHQRSPGEGEG